MPIASMFLAVSMNVSPLLRLEPPGEKSTVSAPSRRAARPKLVRVRVDGSKNRLTTTAAFEVVALRRRALADADECLGQIEDTVERGPVEAFEAEQIRKC